jgi:dTDP-4-amino-4,6-dideoxygalactose transaminase
MSTSTQPFSPWPFFDEDEIEVVGSGLRTGKVNYWAGEQGKLFEHEYADFLGRRYAIALANGTVALELALYAFGIGPGDEVITTCRTFIASASCAVARGATPVVVDVDPVSQKMTVETIRAAYTPKTKAIIVVHLAGWPCEMDEIMAFADEHGIKVIEDCAQAHGATYKGRPVGSMGHAAAFSFCQDKIISTGGEGGLFVTNDEEVWKKAWAYKDHGKNYDAVFNRQHPPGFRWLHESFGTNWRMTEMQAAIGRIQLRKLPEWTLRRQENSAILNAGFSEIPGIRVTLPPPYIGHAYYKYYAFLEPSRLHGDWNRDRIMQSLNDLGVPCYSGSCSEIYLEKAFETLTSRFGERLAVAKMLGENSLMFLVHPTLGECEMLCTIAAVRKVLGDAVSY